MLYGCEVFDICERDISSAQSKLAKRALCTYDTASLTSSLNFLGWSQHNVIQDRRCVLFCSRLILSKYGILSNLAINALADCNQTELPWRRKARLALLRIGLSIDQALTLDSNPIVLHANKHLPSLAPHPALLAAPATARSTFMFTLDSFNPADRRHQLCPMCNAGPDNAAHIGSCSNEDCQRLIATYFKRSKEACPHVEIPFLLRYFSVLHPKPIHIPYGPWSLVSTMLSGDSEYLVVARDVDEMCVRIHISKALGSLIGQKQ